MRFTAKPVTKRKFALRAFGWSALAALIGSIVTVASIQLYLRETGTGKTEGEELARRLFYVMVPDESILVPSDDVSDRLIASVVVRNRLPRTDIAIEVQWRDREGNTLATRVWRRPIFDRFVPGADSMERYIMPEGSPLAGPRNMTLRRDDFPSGTSMVAFRLMAPHDLPVLVRFYTRAQLQPGAAHQETALLSRRERRLEARTSLPSSLAPQELLDRLTGWKWQTIAARPDGRDGASGDLKKLHLFRRDVQPIDAIADAPPELDRVAGLRLGPGKPLSFDIQQEGNYELQLLEGGSGDVEVERRIEGKLPEVSRVALPRGGKIWGDRVPAPASLVIRRREGTPVQVRLVLVPPDGGEPLWVASARNTSVGWLIGPLDRINSIRELGTEEVLRFAPGTDTLKFEFSARAAEQRATLRLRLRAVHAAADPAPREVAVTYRIGGAGRLAFAEERLSLVVPDADLERVPDAWAGVMPGDPVRHEHPVYAVTGPADLFIDIPEEARSVEIRTDVPAVIVPTHTLPYLRPTLLVPEESPDRTLCHIDLSSPDDARVWHYLRPSNEADLRAANAATIIDLPMMTVLPPLRGTASADTLWDREASLPRRHAGSALALWPARPKGAVARSRLFPWSAPWPSSAYRELAPGEGPVPVLYEPGLPDPADILVEEDGGTLARLPYVAGEYPARTKWINRPWPGDENPDPRNAAMLRRAWRATPEIPAEFEVTHDGVETWVSLNVQYEGMEMGMLDIDVETPPWADRPRAWTGNRTEPKRRVSWSGMDAGARAIFIDRAPALAGPVLQTRVRLGPELPAGDFVLHVRPTAGAVWLSCGVSRMGGRIYQNGTAWTFRTEDLRGRRLGVESPGRDPSRDLVFEALVPSRGPSRLSPEPVLDRWTIAVPEDAIALRIRCVSAGPGPLMVTLERPGAPKPLPLPTAETRDHWRVLLPAIDDTYRNPGFAAEVARFRLLWQAPDESTPPPTGSVTVTVAGPAGRTPLDVSPAWIRDPRFFDAEFPKSILWSSVPIEVQIPPGGSEASVRVLSEGFWIRWDRKSGPPAHVAIHTAGSLEFFPHNSFLTRTRRATGLWDEEPHPGYSWPTREIWATPWEYSEGPTKDWPELPLVPVDLTLVGATEQFELARPAAWRKPDARPGPLWRPVALGDPTPAIVGDALGRAKFGALRLSWQDVSIDGDRASSVDVLVDGRLVLTESLFRTRGELSIPGLSAGPHTLLIRPGAGVPAYRCGQWRVRTVDLPREGDQQISSVWKSPGEGEIVFEVEAPQSGEQVVVEVLSADDKARPWGFYSFAWEVPVEREGKEEWMTVAEERHWVSPGAGAEGMRYGANGSAWMPEFRMAWELELLKKYPKLRGRLRGAVGRGDGVHLYRMALESGPLGDLEDVRKR